MPRPTHPPVTPCRHRTPKRALLRESGDELFTTKEPGRGTGLGLWIARNLVEQSFAGTLTVESAVGVGSVFTLTLPLGPAATATDTLSTAALRA